MLGIIIGSALVMFALYRLYFLLKPLLLLSSTLIQKGVVSDVKLYTEEIEQLRIEILELNDAFYNELNAHEKRIQSLESQIEIQKRQLGRERVDKKQESSVEPVLRDRTQGNTNPDVQGSHKVIHPLFDRVKGLYKLGFRDQDIAKELGIGVAEVKLLIKRMEE